MDTIVSTTQQDQPEKDKPLISGDQPLGERAPGTPFLMVGLTYLTVLIVVSLFVAIIMYAL